MLKLQAADVVAVNGEPVESFREIILHYSMKSVLLYDHHTGGNFFSDYSNALAALNIAELMNMTEDNANQEQQIAAGLAMMANPEVNNFLMNAIPALYAKVEGGKFVQNDHTYAEAIESDWIISLINPTTLAQLIEEMSKGTTMQGHNEPQNKKKA